MKSLFLYPCVSACLGISLVLNMTYASVHRWSPLQWWTPPLHVRSVYQGSCLISFQYSQFNWLDGMTAICGGGCGGSAGGPISAQCDTNAGPAWSDDCGGFIGGSISMRILMGHNRACPFSLRTSANMPLLLIRTTWPSTPADHVVTGVEWLCASRTQLFSSITP